MPIKREWTEAEKLELWGPGPWCTEADRVEWRRHGLVCLMTRNYLLGNLCGYVGVPPGHHWHGVARDDIRRIIPTHGGMTYAKPCDHELGVCHVPAPGEPDDLWWFGFDCLRWNDIAPAQAKFFFECEELELLAAKGCGYRDQKYVCEQIDLLADRLSIPMPRRAHAGHQRNT